jgi:hypothetical protein
MSLPLGEDHGVGIAFSRFGANDIPGLKRAILFQKALITIP